MLRSVEDHPQRYTWDRASILTGVKAADVLTRDVLGWAAEPSATRVEQGTDAGLGRARRGLFPRPADPEQSAR